MSAAAIEMSIRKYIAAFNSAKVFSEAEPLFDALYHEDFAFTPKAYNKDHTKYRVRTVPREEAKKEHAELFSKGGELTLVHFRRIGVGCIDVEFHLKNVDEDSTIRAVCSLKDGKILSARQVDTFASVVMERVANDTRMIGDLAGFFLWNHKQFLVR